jgi:N-acetyl-gamma-glutamyl-phosphate reductase
MKNRVFIDGAEGTTGLRLRERLQNRAEIELLTLSEDLRKDLNARRERLNEADFVFLCLPDEAALESVSLITNPKTRVLDASTAHRVNPKWVYGLPELTAEQRDMIANGKRVSIPGCYATGFISLIFPLIKGKIIEKDCVIYSHAVSGYSGAGKRGIAEYEAKNRDFQLDSPRAYALTQKHKHIPEMHRYSGLIHAPSFNPLIADFYSGMTVYVPLQKIQLKYAKKSVSWDVSIDDIKAVYSEHYAGSRLIKLSEIDGYIASNSLSGRDDMELFVTGNPDRTLLSSRFDNLGKGASGAAVQCLNIMMGIDETTGLNLN